MKLTSFITAVLMTFAFGCASQNKKTDAPENTQALQNAADATYIDMMSQHHKDGIDMAQMAVKKGESKEVKKLGAKIIADQSKDIAQLAYYKNRWFNSVETNASMPKMDMSMMENMSGKAFDKHFLTMMTEHHQQAISMSNEYLPRLQQQEVKDFAQKVIQKQKTEVAQMEQLESTIK